MNLSLMLDGGTRGAWELCAGDSAWTQQGSINQQCCLCIIDNHILILTSLPPHQVDPLTRQHWKTWRLFSARIPFSKKIRVLGCVLVGWISVLSEPRLMRPPPPRLYLSSDGFGRKQLGMLARWFSRSPVCSSSYAEAAFSSSSLRAVHSQPS